MSPCKDIRCVYVGCYTDAEHPCGLKALELDAATGAMSVVVEFPVANALSIALSPDGRTLYSCSGGALVSFAANGPQLTPIDRIDVGVHLCHVASMPDGKRVVWADYLGGAAGSVEVEDGRFGRLVRHRHSGSGPNLPRQDAPHCHQALPLPDGSGYCAVDLGLDKIVTYPEGRSYSPVRGQSPDFRGVSPPNLQGLSPNFRGLSPQITGPVPTQIGGLSPNILGPVPGAGPRHLLFHPNGYLAFLVYELANMLTSLRWSRANGFSLLDSASTILKSPNLPIPQSQNPKNLAAAIRLSPDGKRVVVSNRGENSLVAFRFDEATGALSDGVRTILPGDWPREFIFVTDTLALAAMERSGEIHALRYDPPTGRFSAMGTVPQKNVGTVPGIHRPVALAIAQKDV